jgi:hydrogenase maturation protease
MTPRVLVAGIGNIFLSDDGFGVEVANRLAGLPVPEGVKVADFGIRGVHLAYELLDGYDAVILVDALPTGDPPGTVCVFEPETDDDRPGVLDAHGLDPAAVLSMLSKLGGQVGRTLVVGCQPATLDEGIGLSEPVAAAVDEAVHAVMMLLDDEAALAAKGELT